MSNTIEEIYAKIHRSFPDSKEKCQLICTLLGVAGNLTEYVMMHHNVSVIPMNIQYCILITSVNMMGMLSDEVIMEKVDMAENFKLSEQSQEHIYRKMKRAVDIIVESFKKYEEENGI